MRLNTHFSLKKDEKSCESVRIKSDQRLAFMEEEYVVLYPYLVPLPESAVSVVDFPCAVVRQRTDWDNKPIEKLVKSKVIKAASFASS